MTPGRAAADAPQRPRFYRTVPYLRPWPAWVARGPMTGPWTCLAPAT